MFWLLYNLFALLNGLCDGLLYGGKAAESFTWNEHKLLVALRGAAVLAAIGAALDAWVCHGTLGYTLAWLAWQLVSIALSFSLFHNEAYNFMRVWLNEQQSWRQAWAVFKFNYQSSTTTARWDFDGPMRWYMAGAAVLWFAGGVLLFTKVL